MKIPQIRTPRQRQRQPWSRDKLVHERAIALGLAIDASSSGTYDSALNSYLSFCSIHQMPVTPTIDTLSFFVVYMSAHIQPRSVGSYLSGISNKLEPYFPEVRANRSSYLVKRTLAGCLKMHGTPVKRKLPLSRNHVLAAITSLTPSSTHDDILFVAMLCTGFAGLMRLGELSFPDDCKIRDYRKCSLRSSVIALNGGYGFDLPYHKGDHVQFAGQSMRAGGATAMAEDGAAPHLIQAAGCWASDTFQIYIRKNPIILQALLFHGHGDND
ncbi:hypothetical protein BDZ89DRAFT_968319 [Hymenopellis radicata]|nr:hypothetical protein BDZ89DRAFT_968319 [Hymenopellis radicata]